MQDLGGMMSLADAYCRVNRARGLELLSPEDMLAAAKMLEKLALPIRLRVFESGVMVLQLSSHDDNAVVGDTTASVSIQYVLGYVVMLTDYKPFLNYPYVESCN